MMEIPVDIAGKFFHTGNIGQYMGIHSEPSGHMDRRALLTDREREVLRGDATDVKNPKEYRSKIRSRLKKRLDQLETDIDLLDKHEPELAADLYDRVCGDQERRLARLEREVDELRKEINNNE